MNAGRRKTLGWLVVALAGLATLALPSGQRAPGLVVAVALTLWLTELVPVFVPTLALLAAAPWALPGRPEAALRLVLGWAADPVLALFLGGLALSVAAQRHRLDVALAEALIRWSGGSIRALCALLLAGAAFLSMWMSNVAAAALIITALGPVLRQLDPSPSARRALLVSVAMGANVGGLCTPVGSGPNGLAIAAVRDRAQVTFATWMGFATPLAALLLVAVYLTVRGQVDPKLRVEAKGTRTPLDPSGRAVLIVALIAVAAWISEPLHGAPAALISVSLAAALFLSGLLAADDLARIDMSTLLLVAGGILAGHILESSGIVGPIADRLGDPALHPLVIRGGLCAVAALLSALMSNTGTAALLIPIALRVDPTPSLALLVAVSTSLGCPFIVSTPPNALAAKHGARGVDLAKPGLVLMIGGVVLVSLTGPTALDWFGL